MQVWISDGNIACVQKHVDFPAHSAQASSMHERDGYVVLFLEMNT